MPVHPAERQPYEALCELASHERWCWNIICTTCGHMLFRYALRQLAAGVHPNDARWLMHSDHPVLSRGSPLRELGGVPPLSAWPLDEQRQLVQILASADIAAIRAQCKFPDWLGYLGLALCYTEDAERENHVLTQAWAPQLSRLVRPASAAARFLADLTPQSDNVLTWRALETVELGYCNDA
jgi:hypothetical protein